MPNPTAAMLVIGDEILSGRTLDTNSNHLAKVLTEAAIDLCEIRVVLDDHDTIVKAIQALSNQYDHVFTSGGIGPTHDDITADAVGAAFNVKVEIHPEARKILEEHYARKGSEFNDARLRMARVPEGASLIDNPVSAAPGFKIGNVHVMAGVPTVFQAMLAAILPGLKGGEPVLSKSLRINLPEGELAAPLAKIAEAHPELSFGSYPFQRDNTYGSMVVLRGTDQDALDKAAYQLWSELQLHTQYELFAAMEASWPPVSCTKTPHWLIREGGGGGKRVSAATPRSTDAHHQIAEAEEAMRTLRQDPLFQIHPGQEALDTALANAGYAMKDPTLIYSCAPGILIDADLPRLSGFDMWPPLQIIKDVWKSGGIDKARFAVMERACAPKAALLARVDDRVAGAAFIALHENIAVIHAIEVLDICRRQGVGQNILRRAAQWADSQGADMLMLATTANNKAATGLYRSLGLIQSGQYHYRQKPIESHDT